MTDSIDQEAIEAIPVNVLMDRLVGFWLDALESKAGVSLSAVATALLDQSPVSSGPVIINGGEVKRAEKVEMQSRSAWNSWTLYREVKDEQ